jgi:hypothetical protein
MRTPLIALGLALGLACGSAFAQQPPVETPKIEPGLLSAYSEYDANGDGNVTTAEFLALAPAGYEAAARACDTDRNGNLSQAEYDACSGTEAAADVASRPR